MDEVPWGGDDHAPPGVKPRLVTEEERTADDDENKPDPVVWASLKLKKIGTKENPKWVPLGTPLNLYNILRSDYRWVDKVRFNEFDGRLYMHEPGRAGFEEASDEGATRVVNWLDQVYGVAVEEKKVGKQLAVIGVENSWHPVRDYLEALEWDGVPRIADFVHKYLSGEDTEIHSAFSRCWLVSAVARVMDPGCKVDTTLIISGRQGDGKSTACMKLCPDSDWWSGSSLMIGSKDIYDQITGVWLYEIPEVDSFQHNHWSAIKRFMSNQTDRWRRPYGQYETRRGRQVVFFGTTNHIQFLGDQTGSRRFWPVTIDGKTDIKGIMRDRDQIWAEALHQYRLHIAHVSQAADRLGSPWQWWLTDDEERLRIEASDIFQSRSVWYPLIEEWAQGRNYIKNEYFVLADCMKMVKAEVTEGHRHRVEDILIQLGYMPARPRWNHQRRGYYSQAAMKAQSVTPGVP